MLVISMLQIAMKTSFNLLRKRFQARCVKKALRFDTYVYIIEIPRETLEYLKLFFCSDSNFKPTICCQLTVLEFVRSYSQQKLMEESEIP